ncbi:MAG: hypothetical protein ACR2ML_06345 [Solirubrobacteraceae bacterium]
MGEHGSSYARFQRALATGNPTLVTAAALELGRLSLADALAVCLVFRDHDDDHDRYERAAVRWLSRFCQETSGVALRDAQLALAALAALTGPARHGAARALAELAETYDRDDVAQVFDEWLDGSAGDT